jgi:2-hydroxymuconate-semialdehyde hydrolase
MRRNVVTLGVALNERAGRRFHCLAAGLLGLGETETPPDADWSLPAQAAMILAFLDRLSLRRAHVVGHDHGGALAQLLAASVPTASTGSC